MQKPRRKTRPGQTDIANVLGVSVSTVSRALAGSPLINTDIRRQVEEVAVQLGYPLRQKVEHEQFDNIVVLTAIGGFNDARSSVYYSLLEGIREEAARCSPHIETAIVRSGQPIPEEVNRRLTPRTGCIYLGVTPRAETARDLVARQIPCVVSNGIDEELIVDSVAPANFVGGKLMARHLMEHGHREFLYLAGVNRSTLRRRLSGFRQQLEDSAPDGSARLLSIFQGQGNMSEPVFDRFLAWIETERKGATALFCYNDGAAVWAVEAIKSLGLSVPDDISVVGFDDMPVAQVCSPALTTFRIDWVQIGRQTVQLLHERLRDPERDTQLVQVGGTLITRSSVADIR